MLQSLGKYRIDAVIGKGAMGVVYQGFDPHIERMVALKTIHKDLLSAHPELGLLLRFKNEAQAAGRLTHPNIVAVYEYGESDDEAFIAMEFVPSTPLSALLAGERRYPRVMVVNWMTQLLTALDYAHARGVVHRDVKPDNLLIGKDGQLKITDFGIARINASTLTQVGAMVGTPCYMSPEQFRGEVVDGRADVFSSGILLHQLLTGKRPFDGNSFELMHKITREAAPTPSEHFPPLGANWDALLAKALAKEVGERFASARAFLDAMHSVHRANPESAEGGTMLAGAHVRASVPVVSAPATASMATHTVGLPFAAPQPPALPPTDSLPPALASGTSLSGLAGWASEVAPELESMLSSQIGPMARVFLKKSGSTATSLDDLCDSLLQHIPSDKGRAEFSSGVQRLKKKLAASSSGSMLLSRPGTVAQVAASAPDVAQGPPVTDAAIAAAEQKLTAQIGPIAKIMCKRAAAKATDLHQFYRLVAQNLNTDAERTRFLREHGVPG